jgi:polysaccharide export outer membrane protein
MKTTKTDGQRRAIRASLLGAAAAVVATSCTQNQYGPGAAIPPEARVSQAPGVLGPGDVLAISYSGAPELNLVQKVRANGYVSLPMIGDVRASGKRVSGFQSELTGRYKPHLQDPNVLVALQQAAAAVYVSGEVNEPAKIPFDRPITALEAIMEAGGFAPTANLKKVSVVRTEKGAHKRYDLDMTAVLSGASSAFYLKPYDVVYVAQRTW